MKTLRLCGWAVIFTVTLLLAACASHDPRVADSDVMSGPDTTMSQTGMQMHEDSAIVLSQDWLDGRETAVEQRELDLELLDNALVIQQAWHKERALQLDLKEFDLERQGNSLAIQQAWLNERETRLAQSVPDLTKQDDMIAFRQALVSGRVMSLEKTVSRTAGSVKLAGADSSLDKAVSSTTRIEGGQCYAKVIFPAEYKTVAVIKPIDVPKGENLPTLYQTVIEKVKVTDEQMRWEEILCEEKMTECRIIEVQRALDQGGYNPGPIDGIVGQQTIAAVNAFQKDFNLTVANYLTIETVRALDANF
jgi:lysozyme family protein